MINLMKKFLILFSLLWLNSYCIAQPVSEEVVAKLKEYEDYFSQIDGIWEGEIQALESKGAYPDTPFYSKLRIIISKDTVRVLTKNEGKWVELQYDYKILKHKTNAVIFTHASGLGWVETVSITVTLNTINELHVLWQRAVNNFASDPAKMEARGIFQHYTVFKRLEA